jgi:hypothetical protein
VHIRGLKERARTVLDITILDLLQDLGPDCSVDLLVLVDKLGLQLDQLREAATWISDFGGLVWGRRPELRHGGTEFLGGRGTRQSRMATELLGVFVYGKCFVTD